MTCRAERRRGRPLDRLALLVDDDGVVLHERLRVGDAIDRRDLIDDTSTGSRSRRSNPRKPSTEFDDCTYPSTVRNVGEQRVERALHRVAEDERAAEERGAGDDRQRSQHHSRPSRPHAAQRQADHAFLSAMRHVVAMASMMSTLVARRAGMTAAITPTMNDTTRMTIVLRDRNARTR